MVGLANTFTVLVAVLALKHPAVLVATTVYELLDAGETVELPPCMVYVLAPEGAIVNTCPAQIVPLLTETVGNGLTVTELLLEAGTLHPVSVPFTE